MSIIINSLTAPREALAYFIFDLHSFQFYNPLRFQKILTFRGLIFQDQTSLYESGFQAIANPQPG
jgi:hypothetical protein